MFKAFGAIGPMLFWNNDGGLPSPELRQKVQLNYHTRDFTQIISGPDLDGGGVGPPPSPSELPEVIDCD